MKHKDKIAKLNKGLSHHAEELRVMGSRCEEMAKEVVALMGEVMSIEKGLTERITATITRAAETAAKAAMASLDFEAPDPATPTAPPPSLSTKPKPVGYRGLMHGVGVKGSRLDLGQFDHELLQLVLEEQGVSTSTLARLANCSYATITRMRTGAMKRPLKVLVYRVEKILKQEPGTLLVTTQ